MAKLQLRKDDVLFEINVGDKEITFKKVEPIDFGRVVKIPTYKWCYERYYTILNGIPNNQTGRKRDAIIQLSKEVIEVYLYADLTPKTEKSIRMSLEKRINKINDIKSESKRKCNKNKKSFVSNTQAFLKDLTGE